MIETGGSRGRRKEEKRAMGEGREDASFLRDCRERVGGNRAAALKSCQGKSGRSIACMFINIYDFYRLL